jgi:hypothetical protein
MPDVEAGLLSIFPTELPVLSTPVKTLFNLKETVVYRNCLLSIPGRDGGKY